MDNKEFYTALKYAISCLNDLDSIDMVGLAPFWYRNSRLSDEVRNLLIDFYKLSIPAFL